ncbi:MAG: O-antigen ligase family protein [Caldilineaceae bacterium]|nr:O-antigen ligase family protein [Caldilineaceae bacterium]
MGPIRTALVSQYSTEFGRGPNLALLARLRGQQAAGVAALLALAYLLARLPIRWAAASVVAGAFGFLLLRFPWLIWPVLAVALPFASGIDLGPFSLADGLLAAAVAVWFVNGVRCNRLRLNVEFVPGLVLLFLLAVLLSFPYSINFRKAVEGVIKWLEMLLIILLVQEAVPRARVHWLVWGLLAGGALQAALGIYQFAFRIGPPNFLLLDRFMRASGTFGQPNPYAGYLGLTLPVAAALFLHAIRSLFTRPRAWGHDPPAMPAVSGLPAWVGSLAATIGYGGVATVIGLGLVASWSRGGWLGTASSLTVVLLFQTGRRIAIALVAAFAVLLAAGGALARFIPTSLTDRLADLGIYFGLGIWDVVRQPVTNSNFSVIERLAHWIAALRMWELSPWFGIGPGNYAAVYPQVRLPRWEEPLGHAHNIYLNVLAENGLVGLFAYLVMWGGVVGWLVCQRMQMRETMAEQHTFQNNSPSQPAPWNAALLLGVLGVIVHLSVHHLFDYLYVQGIYLHLAFWLASAVALARRPPAVPSSAASHSTIN